MEETNFVLLWKEQYEKIDQSLVISKKVLKELVNQKAKHTLRELVKLKAAGIIAFVFYLLLLGYALYYAITHYSSAANYFIVSVSAIFLINLKGFIDYIKHLVHTVSINYNGSVMEIQQQLLRLQLSIISHAKFMCLQFPFFTTFYLSNSWFPHNVGIAYLIFQILLTGSFVFLSYWLYKNHKPQNLHKKWFRIMIAGSGGRAVRQALEFYKEVEDYKMEKE